MTAPSMRERLGRGPGAPAVLALLRDEPHPVALVGSWAAGAAVVGASPVRTAVGAAAVWAALDEPHVVPPGDARVGGGWIGTLGYGLGASVERLDPPPPRPSPAPSGWLGYYDHVLLLDREGVWWFEALPADEARAAALRDRCATLGARLAAAQEGVLAAAREGVVEVDTAMRHQPRPPRAGSAETLRENAAARLVDARVRAPGYAGHAAAVAAAVEAIGAGEVFQANLCLRVDARLEGAPIDLFARAAEATRPAFGAYVDTGARQLVSLSPERFLRRERATVVASPIKGTAPRDADPAALRTSAKDRAEHVMILDLMRNDLGRVCAFGTVVADPEPRVEPHPGVWHLVSDVRGTLRPGVTDTDVLRATFPPGSVTGAPKVQALHVIGRLEATGREAYTGAIGMVSPLAGLELNVAIRTFEIAGDAVWLGAGGGIVADSDPGAETTEAWRKAVPLLRAAGADLAPPPHEAGTSRVIAARATNTRLLPPGPAVAPGRGFRRPDPGLGVFETVGLDDAGRPRRLDAHLARLAASVATVYDVRLDLTAARALARQRSGAPGRLRLTWSPEAGLAAELAPAGPPRDAPLALRPLVVPGGLGAHKWRDRTILDGEGTPLICDLDGAVLETGWASVWALEGDTLVTPPADGRLLPGVTRQALLDDPAVATAEAPLTVERLRAADAIVLTSSVALAAQAALGDAAPSPVVADLRRRLSDPCG